MVTRTLSCIACFGIFFLSFIPGGVAGEIPVIPELSLSLSLSPPSEIFSSESAELPLPTLETPPCLPTVQTFGLSAPPRHFADTTKVPSVMPPLSAWEKEIAGGKDSVKSKISVSAKNLAALSGTSMKPVDPQYHGQLAWPVFGQVTSAFGPRGSGTRVRMHQGIDIPVPKGTPVQASMAGMVIEARVYNGYGKTVILAHENGMQTLYAHCAELAVKQGDPVELGQVIAYAGRTGRATTSHVHFGVIIEGNFRDPTALLKQKPDRFVRKP